jgi:hypothetical protein
MANINYPFGFRPVRWEGVTCPISEGLTTSNLTCLEGDPLKRNADGSLGQADATSTALYGFAAHGVTGVTGTRQLMRFYPALFSTVFEACAATGKTVNQTELQGYPAGISVATAGTTAFYCKLGATTSVLQTCGINPNSTVDLSLAVVRVRVAKSSYLGVP